MTLESVAKVVESGTKTTKKGTKMTGLSGSFGIWDWDHFFMTRQETTATIPKPLIDKSWQPPTSHTTNSPPSHAIQPPPQPQPQPAPRRRRNPQDPWVMPWILQRQQKGCYSNLLADLMHTDISGYQNFEGCPLPFLTSWRNAFTTASRSQSPVSGNHWN